MARTWNAAIRDYEAREAQRMQEFREQKARAERENRAVMWCSKTGLLAFRLWNGQVRYRDERETLDAPMSDDSKRMMEALIHKAQSAPDTWITYRSVVH